MLSRKLLDTITTVGMVLLSLSLTVILAPLFLAMVVPFILKDLFRQVREELK